MIEGVIQSPIGVIDIIVWATQMKLPAAVTITKSLLHEMSREIEGQVASKIDRCELCIIFLRIFSEEIHSI